MSNYWFARCDLARLAEKRRESGAGFVGLHRDGKQPRLFRDPRLNVFGAAAHQAARRGNRRAGFCRKPPCPFEARRRAVPAPERWHWRAQAAGRRPHRMFLQAAKTRPLSPCRSGAAKAMKTPPPARDRDRRTAYGTVCPARHRRDRNAGSSSHRCRLRDHRWPRSAVFRKPREVLMNVKAGNSSSAVAPSRKSAMSLPAVNIPPAPANTTAPIEGSRSACRKACVAAIYIAPVSAFFFSGRSKVTQRTAPVCSILTFGVCDCIRGPTRQRPYGRSQRHA